MADEKQQFNVYLPSGLVRRIKHASVDAGQSLSSFVEAALERYLITEHDGEHGERGSS